MLLSSPGAAAQSPDAYRQEIESFRARREAELRAEDGWLALAGLHWLKDGESRIGSAPGNDLQLPKSAPAHLGVIEQTEGKVRLRLALGATASIGGKPIDAPRELLAGAKPDIVELGAVSFLLIQRDKRNAIRVRDTNSDVRRDFKGLDWFPIDPAARVVARFTPHAEPRRTAIPNVIGYVSQMKSPGIVSFRIGDRELTLEPVFETAEENELFFIFKDQTAGKDTYGAGRFLYAAPAQDGTVVLDFNKAYSPPCAFTPYATCPLPPKQNVLALRIEAGERFSGH